MCIRDRISDHAQDLLGDIVFVQGELQYSKLEDGTYYTSIVCGRFDSRIELCEKKDSAGVKDDDAPPF